MSGALELGKPRNRRPVPAGRLGSSDQAFYWSHLLLAGFFTVAVGYLLLSIPRIEFGTAKPGYSAGFLFRTVFPLLAAALAFASTWLRDQTRDREAALLGWRVRDKLTSMRHHEYFLDRIALECERAKRDGSGFAIIVLELQLPADGRVDAQQISRAIALLQTRPGNGDCLAPIGESELALLSPGMGAEFAPAAAARLRDLVATGLDDAAGLEVGAGWAVYGENGLTRPSELLARARANK